MAPYYSHGFCSSGNHDGNVNRAQLFFYCALVFCSLYVVTNVNNECFTFNCHGYVHKHVYIYKQSMTSLSVDIEMVAKIKTITLYIAG